MIRIEGVPTVAARLAAALKSEKATEAARPAGRQRKRQRDELPGSSTLEQIGYSLREPSENSLAPPSRSEVAKISAPVVYTRRAQEKTLRIGFRLQRIWRFNKSSDRQIAIYEFLSAIPCLEGGPGELQELARRILEREKDS